MKNLNQVQALSALSFILLALPMVAQASCEVKLSGKYSASIPATEQQSNVAQEREWKFSGNQATLIDHTTDYNGCNLELGDCEFKTTTTEFTAQIDSETCALILTAQQELKTYVRNAGQQAADSYETLKFFEPSQKTLRFTLHADTKQGVLLIGPSGSSTLTRAQN